MLDAGVTVTTAPSQLLFSFANATECVAASESDETTGVDSQSDVLLASQTELVATHTPVELDSASNLLTNASKVDESASACTNTNTIHSVASNNMHYSTQLEIFRSTNSPKEISDDSDMQPNTSGPVD